MMFSMRRWLLLALLAPVILAPVVAASMVPDPDWIGGWFDGADGDEISALVFDRTVAIAVPVLTPPAPAGSAPLALEPVIIARVATPPPHSSRAPPVAA
jgi:hypothetical protein